MGEIYLPESVANREISMRYPNHHRGLLAASASGLLLLATPALAQITRVSVGAAGVEANADSYDAALSDNGQVIAFRSTASNLTVLDDSIWPDIFVRDLGSATTEMVSNRVSPESRRYSLYPTISDNGQIVVMNTDFGYSAIVVHDRSSGTSTIELPPYDGPSVYGRLEPSLSGNGQFIAFYSIGSLQDTNPPEARPTVGDTNIAHDAYVFDRVSMPIVPIESVSRDSAGVQGTGDSFSPTLTDDGRYVAFYSYVPTLVPGDTNEHEDIFVKDRQSGGIVMASVAGDGSIGNGDSYKPVIAGAGRYVAFRSQASNLVAGDTNRHWDIFVRDMTLGATTRVSVSSSGAQSNHDSFEADISDDGRYVVFRSNASNLVADDTNQRFDIFVHDRQTGQTMRVSKAATEESNGHSYNPAISGDGQWIVFESDATNLIAGDSNVARDIFRVPNPLAAGGPVNNGGH